MPPGQGNVVSAFCQLEVRGVGEVGDTRSLWLHFGPALLFLTLFLWKIVEVRVCFVQFVWN